MEEHIPEEVRKVKVAQYVRWEAASRDTIDVKRAYIDITGDLAAGVLLSQIIYWYLPLHGSTNPRLSQSPYGVWHDDKWWLVRKRTDWWEECRLKPKQFDYLLEALITKGFIVTRVAHFNGAKALHIFLDLAKVYDALEPILDPGKCISEK